MLLSHECPACMMSLVSKYIDYNYYLDVFMLNKSYNQSMRNGKDIYLDCSLYERSRRSRIEDLDEGIYMALYNKLCRIARTYIVVPDRHNDSRYNIDKAKEYSSISDRIITVHGKDLDDYISCLKYYIDNEDGIIALSAGDSFCDSTTRTRVLEKIDVKNRKIHIFGLRTPDEMYVLKNVKESIYSLDTSLPVVCALKGLHIKNVKKKPGIVIFDEFNDEHCYDSELLISNMMYMRDLYEIH